MRLPAGSGLAEAGRRLRSKLHRLTMHAEEEAPRTEAAAITPRIERDMTGRSCGQRRRQIPAAIAAAADLFAQRGIQCALKSSQHQVEYIAAEKGAPGKAREHVKRRTPIGYWHRPGCSTTAFSISAQHVFEKLRTTPNTFRAHTGCQSQLQIGPWAHAPVQDDGASPMGIAGIGVGGAKPVGPHAAHRRYVMGAAECSRRLFRALRMRPEPGPGLPTSERRDV
jgi:hypothetical protein